MSDITYRRLGTSGLAVSSIGLGANNFGMRLDLDGSRKVIETALEAGISLIDTSDSYGESETILGEVLAGRRDEVVLATKFGSRLRREDVGPDWGARGSRRYIRQSVERSLRRLRTDWIDLYQMHYPDPTTPIEETLSALSDLVHEGKVRYIGSSNMAPWQAVEAEWVARTNGLVRFISAQNEYSFLEREVERELVPALQQYGVGLLPYFPLASGMLTGKYRRGEEAPKDSRIAAWGMSGSLTDARFGVVEGLQAFARERGITLLDVAIGGLAAQPAVGSVIAGATSPEQVLSNVAGAAWTPTAQDRAELDRLAPTAKSD